MRSVNKKHLGFVLSSVALFLAAACGRAASNIEDSQTHWLDTCGTSGECDSALECVCGRCVAPCDEDSACSVPGMTTTCAADDSDAVAALCSGHSQLQLCLESCREDDECGEEEACLAGLCVPASLSSVGGTGGAGNGGASAGDGGTPSVSGGGSGGGAAGEGGGGSTAGECEALSVSDCEAAGCALVSGTEASGSLNGQAGVYGCQAPDRSCPPSGVCAHDPEDTNHVVWFGNCAPAGWLPDRSDPSACEGLLTVDCASLREPACLSTPACTQLYGAAPDGSTVFGGCAPANVGGDGALVCAVDASGRHLLFPTTTIPDDWTPEEALTACEPECFSPFRNAEQAGQEDFPGCPCDSAGSICLDGTRMECWDGTDDLRSDPFWTVSAESCDAVPDCSGGVRAGECLARFELCVPSGEVELNFGTALYCGDTPLPCGVRSELACGDGCSVLIGTSLAGESAFAGCAELMDCEESAHPPRCVQNQQALLEGQLAEPIYLPNVCAPAAGWTPIDLAECTTAIQAECALRDEGSCSAPCAPATGRKPGGDVGQFIACSYPECTASRTVCATDGEGNIIEFFGCLALGWTEVDGDQCTAP